MIRRVAVVGATGFIGRHVIPSLVRANFEITALARTLSGEESAVSRDVEWQQGDLNVPEVCDRLVRDVDAVVHLAHTNSPLTSNADLRADAALNLLPTLTLIEAIRRRGSGIQVVFASSGGAVYGTAADGRPFSERDEPKPLTSYGIQKLAIEQYLGLAAANRWLSAVVLRIGNAYGDPLPRARLQGVIGVAVAAHARHEPVRIFGDPANVRDYVHLDDLARAFELALTPVDGFHVYNIGSGVGLSVTDILALLERVSGRPVAVQQTRIEGADLLPPWVVLDVGRANETLGWRAEVSPELGVKRLWDGLQK